MGSSYRLVDLCEQIVDCPHSTPVWTDFGVIVLRSKNIRNGRLDLTNPSYTDEHHYQDRVRRAIPSGGDLVITREAPMGEVCMIPSGVRCCLGQRMVLLRPNKAKVDPRYLLFVLQSPQVQHEIGKHEGTGSTVSNLRIPALEALPIPTPPLPEQRAIAAVLGALDDKIELNRRMNGTLEAMARALFKSWFVDFDPVRAKMDGRPAGLPAELSALFPEEMEEGRPRGWGVKRIEDIAERVGMGPFGSSIKVETFVDEGVPIISGQHLRNFIMEDNKFNFVTHEHAEKLKNSLVRRGDIIFTHAGSIGQAAFIPEHSRFEQYIISQRQFFMRSNIEYVTPSYISLFFTSQEGRHKLLANTSSSGVPSIARPVTYLRSIELVIPPKGIMEEFERVIKPLINKITNNKLVEDQIGSIRDALLPKLMSGEVRVADTDKYMEKAL